MDDVHHKIEIVSMACRSRSEGPLTDAQRASCAASKIAVGYDTLQQGAVALTCWDDLAGSEHEWIGERRFHFCRSLSGFATSARGVARSREDMRAGALEAAESRCAPLFDASDDRDVAADRCKLALMQEALRLAPRDLKPESLPDGVQLRPWQAQDANAYAAIMTDPRVWEFLPNNGELDQLSSIDADSVIAATNAGTHHRVHAIIVDGQPAGQVRVIFHPTVAGVRSGELVYLLGDRFRGRGLMSRILPAYVADCFEELSLDVLVAWIHPENRGSQRCAERAGFFRNRSHYESRLAMAVERDGYQQYLCFRVDFAGSRSSDGES